MRPAMGRSLTLAPVAKDAEICRVKSIRTRYIALFSVAALLVLLWILSIADPCLIAILSGGPSPTSNPIAITECHVNEAGGILISRGDAIIRLAALALLSGLFGLICRLLEPERRKRNFGGIAAVGATWAFAIYAGGQFFLFANASLAALHLKIWVISTIVACLAVMVGAAIAETTEQPSV
jgi:hypothetical protein